MKKIFYSAVLALALFSCSNDDSVTPRQEREDPIPRVKTVCELLKEYVVGAVYLKNDTGYVYNQGLQNINCLETTSDSIFAYNYSEGNNANGINAAYRFYKFSIADVEANADSINAILYQTIFDDDTTAKDQKALFVKFKNADL